MDKRNDTLIVVAIGTHCLQVGFAEFRYTNYPLTIFRMQSKTSKGALVSLVAWLVTADR